MNVKKILLPIDFSECSNVALDHALLLAEHLGAQLDFLHVIVLHDIESGVEFPDAAELHQRHYDLASSEMKDLLEGRDFRQLDVRHTQRRAVAAAPAIVDYAAEEEVDLIVMGAHGRRGFRRFLLGSVAEEVVRMAPCPVLTIRGTGDAPAPRQVREVLVPFDFSDHSKTALATAGNLAASYGGRLHLLHVLEPIMEPHPYVPLHYRPEEFDLSQLSVKIAEDLGRLAEETLDPDVEREVRVVEGHPALSISEHAEQIGADLIVIATHGRTGLGRFFLGSVTEKVARTASCPVLTLKVDAEP